MEKHIIFAAFGTTTQAKNTYTQLDSLIKPHFPGCHFHWTYTSPTIHHNLSIQNSEKPLALEDLLDELRQFPDNRVVIQSIHITPGNEFHRIVRKISKTEGFSAIGMPLLTSPKDFRQVTNCLLPLIRAHQQEAILILGHGTSHPSWTVYPALENILRQMAGERIFVAALEKFPDSSNVVNKITAQGFTKVLVIPFLMVAGMHFTRDITGDAPGSWKNKLEEKNIGLILHKEGLGLLEGISDIFCEHIRDAFRSLLG